MAAFVPAPSMIVVASLSIVTFLALPRSSILTFSSLMPRSSVSTRPPVRIAMSSRISLRRSPYPGALTAATFSVPRSLLTTSMASASVSRFLGDDEQRPPELRHPLEQRQQARDRADFLFV